eukprot:Hpha_TRINITY_DN16075_c0_g9::TRINITY_DN16075_c0_g9_i1::g.116879::m.116879
MSGVVLYALVGAAESRVTLELEVDATIGDLKRAVHEAGGFPPEEQVVEFSGDTLTEDSATLADLGISTESTVLVQHKPPPPPAEIEIERADPRRWMLCSLILGATPAIPLVWSFFGARKMTGRLLGCDAVLSLATAAVDYGFIVQERRSDRLEKEQKVRMEAAGLQETEGLLRKRRHGIERQILTIDAFGNCVSTALVGLSYLILLLSPATDGTPRKVCTGVSYVVRLPALFMPGVRWFW